MNQTYIETSASDPLVGEFQKLLGRKICIMGGCGQVGSHTITKLYEMGASVNDLFINDNLSLGKVDNLPEAFRSRVDTRSHSEYVESPGNVPDVLIFVGGRSSAPHFASLDDVFDEIQTWKRVLEWCVKDNIRLIFASTSSLCKSLPSIESQNVWPGSFYELTKLMMEQMSIQQVLTEGLVCQICRFFSVYGITEQHKGNFGNLYTQILWHAQQDKEFEVWGKAGSFQPGEQTRDTIFAVEVARAILFLLSMPSPKSSLEDISSLTFNIGQGNPVSVNDMIESISIYMKKEIKINKVEVPTNIRNYVVHTWGDPSKLIDAGFKPLFSDHVLNLGIIDDALTNISEYWEQIEMVRSRMLV